MHVVGADLHFDRHAIRPEQRGVQRLIAVDARDRDVVLEAAGHRLVHAVHGAERAIAGIRLVDDHAQAIDVDDVGERGALARHLLVDAVEMFLARFDFARYLGLLQRGADLLGDLAEEFLLVAARALQRALEHAIALRIGGLEAEVFELELEVVQPETLGDRRIDLERFARNGPAPRRLHRVDRAHVVRAVRELDEDHAQIAHHREDHLAERFRLRFLAALELDLVELGDAVDDLGHRLTELRGDLGLVDRRVFHDVVQDRGDDRVRIHAQLREDLRRGDGMRDVGFAGFAPLALVGGGTEFRGAADALDLIRGKVGLDGLDQPFQPRRAALTRQQTQECGSVVHDTG